MIKFVYFDVGGVVVKDFSDSPKWKELRYSLGVGPGTDAKFLEVWEKYRSRICIDYDIDDMISELNTEVGLSIPHTYSFLQGFIDRFERNESIWPAIQSIKKTMRVGLLTNMYVRMLDGITKKGLFPAVQWDVIVDSSIVKMQKPDKALFALAERKAGVHGSEILFIDNQEKHVNAAKEFGWQGYHYDSSDYEKSSAKLKEFFSTLH